MTRKPPPAPQEAPGRPPAISASATKSETILALLRRPEGATAAFLASATGWPEKSIRAHITNLKRAGHVVTTEKAQIIYRVTSEETK